MKLIHFYQDVPSHIIYNRFLSKYTFVRTATSELYDRQSTFRLMCFIVVRLMTGVFQFSTTAQRMLSQMQCRATAEWQRLKRQRKLVETTTNPSPREYHKLVKYLPPSLHGLSARGRDVELSHYPEGQAVNAYVIPGL